MSRIEIGKNPAGRTVYADLDVLIRTRALIQASSGGGKSYLIRRMAEQIFGKVPEFIIDEEGEFPSLRCEKFPFVLVGRGGDTPADPRSAQILAHRLLEHRTSAIFDLSELKPQVRHHWVRLFFEALVEAPRALWTPVIVFLDEAHHYAPEKGDSEARGAVVDAATRGRKRGICLIPATQRLAKLSKDVTGELLNRFIGPTFEDLDIERAADLLSIVKAEKPEFAKAMRVLAPGNFQLLGRAFGTDRIQVKVGPVETTPPEIGRSKEMLAPPPPPEKIKAFLPKLADLPKEAEEKAKTESELRKEIRTLKAEVVQLGKRDLSTKPGIVNQPPPKQKIVEFPIMNERQLRRIESVVGKMHESAGQLIAAVAEMKPALLGAMDKSKAPPPQRPILKFCPPVPANPKTRAAIGAIATRAVEASRPATEPFEGLKPAHLRILTALAEFEAIGRELVDRTWVAARAQASHRSSAYSNNLGFLRTNKLIEYGAASTLRLTEAGRAAVPQMQQPLTSEEMQTSCSKIVSPAQWRIMKALIDAYPSSVARDQVAEQAGASASSSAFSNNLGALRSAGMIEYGPGSTVKASDWLFID